VGVSCQGAGGQVVASVDNGSPGGRGGKPGMKEPRCGPSARPRGLHER
jgi:hypothetical protein